MIDMARINLHLAKLGVMLNLKVIEGKHAYLRRPDIDGAAQALATVLEIGDRPTISSRSESGRSFFSSWSHSIFLHL
jgi:hypothetical protein